MKRFFGTILFVFLAGGNLPTLGDEFITQYRYRPFDGAEPEDWISSYVAGSTRLPAVVKNEYKRDQVSDAFQDFWYGDFDGTRRYVCADDVAGNDLSGAVSVQAFFCLPSISSSVQTICSTVSGQTGFRLYIDDGILKGGCYYQSPQGAEVTVAATESLEKDIWYHVALVARRGDADVNELHLWVNSQKVATNDQTPATRAIDNSTLDPVFGAERSGNGFKDYLNAKVHAIEVNDYALSDFYLGSKVIRDGSRYFGIPSYHDYIGEGEDAKPLERRIMETYGKGNLADFRRRLQDRFYLPFMNDNYIPQGVAADPENERMFISYYYKDKDYNTDHPSIVAEIFMPSGTLGNVFILNEKDAKDGRLDDDGKDKWSHVGGIAYWEGYLFVPDSKDLLLFDISDIEPSGFDPLKMTGFNAVTIDRVVRFKNQVPWDSIAFIDIHEEAVTGKPIIALGDYTVSGDFSSPKPFNDSGEFLNREGAQELAAIDLYYLNKTLKNSDWEIELSPKKETLNEAYLYTQGVKTYFDSEIGRRLFYSVTGNKPDEEYSPAKIYHATYEWFDDHDHDHWLNALTRELVCYTPRGNEDLALYDGKLWTVSESGAKYFQKLVNPDNPFTDKEENYKSWDQLFPFLFSISVDDYFEAIPNEAPILEDIEWKIIENSSNGTEVVLLNGIDANQDALTYSIVENANSNGNKSQAFRVQGNWLLVNDFADLDYEANSELTIRVRVNDGELSDLATITVLLNDDRNEDADGDGLTEAEEEDTHGTSDHNADSDGDGFADGVEVAANTDPADPMSRPPLADSVAGFSGAQGQDGWYHGYRNYTEDGGGDDYDADNDFVAFDAGDWTGEKWDLGGGAPWTEIGPNYTHPNGTNSAPQEEHWTVRRWVAGELTGTTPVAITWSARKINNNGNGVTGSLHINGTMVDSRVVPGDDQVEEVRTFYANLLPEDIVDLALSPAGVGSRSDGNDSSRNWFSVSDAVPEDPVQPDGTPFVPFVIAPVANNDVLVTLEDRLATFNVLLNDTDVDGDGLMVQLISGPGFGAVTALGKGVFTYAPAADFHGTDTFSYVVTDSSGATDTATVTITVTAVNDAPEAVASAAYVIAVAAEDGGLAFNLKWEREDGSGDIITGLITFPPDTISNPPAIRSHTSVPGSRLIIQSGGTTTNYDDPRIYFHFDEQLDFDGELVGQSDFGVLGQNGATGDFNVFVNGFTGRDYFTLERDADGEKYVLVGMSPGIFGQLIATDIDHNATLSYALDAPVEGLTLNAEGSYHFDPSDVAYQSLPEGQTLEVVANWTVTDEHGATDASTLTITVKGSAPWPPVRITSVVGDGVPGELTALRLTFVSRTGKVYAVERSRDLVGWNVLRNINGENDSTEYIDTDPILDGGAVFYRVRVVE